MSKAARTRTTYRCTECGWETPKWLGRCSGCREFSTMVEVTPTATTPGGRTVTAVPPARAARPVTEVVGGSRTPRISTGLGELDRVLGGGLVAGQVLLLAGEPGVGKSTLLLEASQCFAAHGATPRTVLYVSGEESVEQIGVRAERIGATSERVMVADENNLEVVLGHVEAHRPELVIIDSVQTMASADVEGRAGGIAQVIGVTQTLTNLAKRSGVPVLLIGQSTRENAVAGPRALEHLVDTVLTFEGDRHTALRLLRATKNRYGPADEVACFEQRDNGLAAVEDPSQLFRAQRDLPVPGTCVTVSLEGRRALLAEVQALVADTSTPNPRRTVSGLDTNRVNMLLAVAQKVGSLRLHDKDVYVSTVAGMRLADPSSDLAVCLALASAWMDTPLPANRLAIGEVALSGDIRPVQGLGARVAEASRLGFRTILVPPIRDRSEIRVPSGVRIVEVAHLGQALDTVRRVSRLPVKTVEDASVEPLR